MREIYAIGIGAGNIEQLTLEAITALNKVDYFLVPDKGEIKSELVDFRKRACQRFIDANHDYEFITVPDPQRGDDAQRDAQEYLAGVKSWHQRRTENYVAIINDTPADAVIGFLVWGDPAFYDSTLRIIAEITKFIPAEVKVIPGISAVQLLAAAHKIPLNRVGSAIHITTGRRLAAEYHPSLGDVVVMLDGHLACQELISQYPELYLYWGAYLGADNEVLHQGKLIDVLPEIVELRAELKQKHGWVMDTYLLRPNMN